RHPRVDLFDEVLACAIRRPHDHEVAQLHVPEVEEHPDASVRIDVRVTWTEHRGTGQVKGVVLRGLRPVDVARNVTLRDREVYPETCDLDPVPRRHWGDGRWRDHAGDIRHRLGGRVGNGGGGRFRRWRR